MRQSTKTKFSILKELIGKNWKSTLEFLGWVSWIVICLFFCINVSWWLLLVAVAPCLFYAQYNYLNTMYEDRRQVIVDSIEKELSDLEWYVRTKSAAFCMTACDKLSEYLNDYAQYCGKDCYYERSLFRFENLLKIAQTYFEN